ncbi:peptidase S8, partial [Candidatus Desantisbacteria bacterium]|nr:peptidase S8 [Candidatus Desantisbacteria bacterium]
MVKQQLKHIFLRELPDIKNFTSNPSGRKEPRIPDRDRQVHSKYLFDRLNIAWQQAEKNKQAVAHSVREGVYIEFKSSPGYDLITKSLEEMRSKKIRLLNIRTEGDGDTAVTYATVYVAN